MRPNRLLRDSLLLRDEVTKFKVSTIFLNIITRLCSSLCPPIVRETTSPCSLRRLNVRPSAYSTNLRTTRLIGPSSVRADDAGYAAYAT